MKRIILRAPEEGPHARELFTIVLNAPGADGKGITVQEMRKRIKIIDKIEDTPTPELLVLEDAECEHLKRLFDAFPWGMTSKEIVLVADDLEKAEKYDPPKEGVHSGSQ